MSKFKVGDKVRILDGSKIENYTGHWNRRMNVHVGEVHTITLVNRNWTGGRVSYKVDGFFYNWDERGLELVSEKKIVITVCGKNTYARLYEGKKLVRGAVARCAPDDKFDFNVGARLAFERLIGTSPSVTSLDWNKFAHGKLEVKVNKKTYDAFIKQCEQRGFVWYGGRKVNPWKIYDEMPCLIKSISGFKGTIEFTDYAPGVHMYISVVGGVLKWCEKRDEALDEYEFI